MVDNVKSKEDGNKNAIMSKLSKNQRGLSLSDLARETGLSPLQVKTSISFLLGSKKIEEQAVGRAKVYFVI